MSVIRFAVEFVIAAFDRDPRIVRLGRLFRYAGDVLADIERRCSRWREADTGTNLVACEGAAPNLACVDRAGLVVDRELTGERRVAVFYQRLAQPEEGELFLRRQIQPRITVLLRLRLARAAACDEIAAELDDAGLVFRLGQSVLMNERDHQRSVAQVTSVVAEIPRPLDFLGERFV